MVLRSLRFADTMVKHMDPTLRDKIIEENIKVHQQEAPFYDLLVPEIFCQSEQRIVRQVLDLAIARINKGGIVALDVGAGTGNVSLKLDGRKEVASITAVDLSADMLSPL